METSRQKSLDDKSCHRLILRLTEDVAAAACNSSHIDEIRLLPRQRCVLQIVVTNHIRLENRNTQQQQTTVMGTPSTTTYNKQFSHPLYFAAFHNCAE